METSRIRRSSDKYRKLSEFFIIICSVVFIGVPSCKITSAEIGEENKRADNDKLSAGVTDAMIQSLNTFVQLKSLGVEIVTTSPEEDSKVQEIETQEEIKPEIIYKSLDEVEISRNMDLTKTTGLSKEDFYKLMSDFKYDYAGFYEKNADLIWQLSQKYQVNEIFICGVFGLESYYGSDDYHIVNHNYGSIMNKRGRLVYYANDAEGIEANFKLFANSYLSAKGKYHKGVTLDSIGNTYCPPTSECPSWASKVYDCMKKFL